MGVVFAFNTNVLEDAKEEAEVNDIKILSTNVVYRLIEEYEKWKIDEKTKEKEELLKKSLYPMKLRVLPGHVFRQSKPAVVGVEILDGILKTPCPIMTENGKRVGKIKEIQDDKKTIPKAEAGKKVAISIEGVTIGRQVNENDVLLTNIPLNQIHHLEKEVEEKELLNEIKQIKKQHKEEPI